MIRSAFIKSLLYLCAYIPLPYLQSLSQFLARRLSSSQLRAVHTCKANIALCYPELDARAQQVLVEQSLAHGFTSMLELGHIWLRHPRHSLSLVKAVENPELFAQYQDQPLIMLTPHLGAWELAGLYASSQRQITSLYKPPKLAALDNFIKTARERGSAHLVPTTPHGIRQLFKALKKAEVIGILPDQEPRLGSGAFAEFKGQPAYTMSLIHRLVQKTKVKVLLCYTQRLPDGQGFHIIYKQPPEAIYSDDEKQALSALNQAIESCFVDNPEQYQWTYKRFKRRPDGLSSVYD